jgi:hypothetical protein
MVLSSVATARAKPPPINQIVASAVGFHSHYLPRLILQRLAEEPDGVAGELHGFVVLVSLGDEGTEAPRAQSSIATNW